MNACYVIYCNGFRWFTKFLTGREYKYGLSPSIIWVSSASHWIVPGTLRFEDFA